MSTSGFPLPNRGAMRKHMAEEARRIRVSKRTNLCGCFLVDTGRRQYLPLLDSESYTTIFSGTSKTVLKQTFVSSFSLDNAKEYMYSFPLYDGVSVVGFECKIGSKSLYGLVKEKKKAEAIFDTVVAKGDTAGLLIQGPEASDVFITRIGNIPPGETVFVKITYICELKQDDIEEGICFTIPTTIAPRYGLTGSVRPLQGAGSGTKLLDHSSAGIRITVDIILPDGHHIKGIESPSHLIAVSIGTISIAAQAVPVMNKASATLSLGTTTLEKDFVLIMQFKHTGIPKALLETHPTIPNHRALMVTLVSKFPLRYSPWSDSPSEIVFVADRSASMRNNISMLISALKVFLKSLPTSISFNICSFGTDCKFMWPQSKSYNNETLQEAVQYISTFESNYGGTETFKALKATIERRLTGLPLEIIILTDGNITDQQSLFSYINEQIEETRGDIRVFSLGIGNQVSHALIEGLARAGNGLSKVVQDGERLDKSVIHMLREALSPHIGNGILEVKYGEDDDDFELVDEATDEKDDMETLFSETEEVTTSLFYTNIDNKTKSLPKSHYPNIIQAPHKIPSLFDNARTTVYLLMGPKTIQRNPTSVILRSSSSHGPPILEIPIEVLTERGTTIHQLAARKASQDLEESRGWMFGTKVADVKSLLEKEAVRLGQMFQVVNKWCSFVAVSSEDGEILTQNTTRSDLSNDILSPAISDGRREISSPARPLVFIPRPPQNTERFKKTKISSRQLLTPVQHPNDLNVPFNRMENTQNHVGSIRTTASGRIIPEKIPKDVEAELVSNVLTTTDPTVSPPNSNSMKVLALIDLQSFDGPWNISKSLLHILGFEIPKPPQGMSEEAWITIFIVTLLEEKVPEEEDVWGLVVEKARKYLRTNLGTEDPHLAEEIARLVIEKSCW
ncbi:hypothetical protein OCU04_002705 [Sclerotinia nivalis]|uniref:von Willebrand domain-containing protein n=1 Tax=Sclerotinia nivalis TaxID=352851 RepID=A0A9X0DMH1_9HELO|nr:hypothetical protein OCU04_002705 [Sclerotinia nivalis]